MERYVLKTCVLCSYFEFIDIFLRFYYFAVC
nr:MAG TPA: hypothetical protein [Caudoviricetes sp.]